MSAASCCYLLLSYCAAVVFRKFFCNASMSEVASVRDFFKKLVFLNAILVRLTS